MKYPEREIERLLDEANFERQNDNDVKADDFHAIATWALWARREVFLTRERLRIANATIEEMSAEYDAMRSEAGYR